MKHGKGRKGKRQRRQGQRQGQTGTPAASASSAGAARPAEAAERPASGGAVTPWWESEPGRLEYELAELEAAGIEYEVDDEARANGILILHLTVTMEDGERLRLVARFPDLYPYVRFEVLAPDLTLERHQNPLGHQLCLIGRGTHNWNTTDTLASYIKERLPKVLRGARSSNPDEVAELEEHQGEPFSDYYPYRPEHMLLVDGSWDIDPSVSGGVLTVGFGEQAGAGLRGAVLKVKDEKGLVLTEADQALSRIYPRRHDFRWIRLDAPIREDDLERFFEMLYSHDIRLQRPLWRQFHGRSYDIVGILFPEEQRWREQGNGWVFAIKSMPYGGAKGQRIEYFLTRAGRAGRIDLTERVPELRMLRERKVAVIGLGGLGAPSAFELARSGIGELRPLDHDYVDPATTVRWPLGLTAAGKSKVSVVTGFIEANYPYTKVVPFEHRLGVSRVDPAGPSDIDVLNELLEGVHLVYDASAEIGLNHILSDLAAARSIPYVCVSTTHGAWGGRLIRVRPNGRTSGCWMCHQWALSTGEISMPPTDPRGEVQPAGCSDPTFTGSGFDIASIALAGVRLAVSTLSEGTVGAYPSVDWDVVVIHLRDDDGRLLTPARWDTFTLERHRECKNERAHGR